MAINPIALQTKAADFGGALNTLAAVRQLQAAGQQRQMNELAIQEAQRKQAENQALSKALSQYDIGTPEGLNALRRIGPKGFEYASAVEKMRQEAQTAKKSALKTDLDLFSKAAGSMADSPENYTYLYQGAIKDNPELASYLPSPEQYQPGVMQRLAVGPEAMFRRETAMKTLEGQQSLAQQRMQSADERARLNREAQEEQNRLNRELRQQGIDLQRQQLEATTAQQRKRLTLDERKQRWAEKTEVPEFKQAMASAEARGKEIAKNAVTREMELPSVIQQAEVGLNVLDQMIGDADVDTKGNIIIKPTTDKSGKVIGEGRGLHPGFASAVGFGLGERFIPGTEAASFNVLHDQITGQAFLQAYETLKGGGQITNIEGQKATAAINRMNLAQNEREYLIAAREFQAIVRRGIERAKAQVGSGASQAAPAAGGMDTGGWTIEGGD